MRPDLLGRRVLFVSAWFLAEITRAQIQDLATVYDGSAVYFSTTSVFKERGGAVQGRIYRWTADEGTTVYRERERIDAPFRTNQYSLMSISVSRDGKRVAYAGQGGCTGACSAGNQAVFVEPAAGDPVTPALDGQAARRVDLNGNGRYAVLSGYFFDAPRLVDLSSGATRSLGLSDTVFHRHAVTDDGGVVGRSPSSSMEVRLTTLDSQRVLAESVPAEPMITAAAPVLVGE
ncbi:MAG: hypothetical protein U0Q16_23735 [Bryobacteraceae bacterium]